MKWLLLLLMALGVGCAHRVPTEVLLMQYAVEASQGSPDPEVKGELEARGFECNPRGCWKPDG